MPKSICHCKAYPFPHRFLGGKCDDETVVDAALALQDCDDCEYVPKDMNGCKLLDGRLRSYATLCPLFPRIVKENKK